jgi:prephenate dehydrogenase
MQTIAIVGTGLIGGSFGLALRKAGFRGDILGVSSERALKEAVARGAIDQGMSLEKAVASADVVYLSQTIGRILQTLQVINPWLRPGTLVTDAGSTKTAIMNQAHKSILDGEFLGGHPMAGKEKRGVAEADPDLFSGRVYVLTPATPTAPESPAVRDFLDWLIRIGAVPLTLTAEEHDHIVGYTSHLPQLASTALAATLAENLMSRQSARVAGSGLSDMTRLAMSSFDIWQDILATNADGIERALSAYIAKLQTMRKNLRRPAIREQFKKAEHFSKGIRGT